MPPILLIGLGRWGSQHLRILQSRLPTPKIFVADPAPAAAPLAASLGVPPSHFSHHFETFLNSARAAIVATPAPTHAPITRQLLAAQLDVLVEKPVAPLAHDGFQLAGLAHAHNRILQVGHILRFHPAIHWLRHALQQKVLGDLRLVQANFTDFKRPRRDTGITLADTVHLVDLCRYLLDSEPHSVRVQTFDVLRRGKNWDDASWTFLNFGPLENLTHAILETHYFAPVKSRLLTLVGSRLTARCDLAAPNPRVSLYPHRHTDPDGSGTIHAVTEPEQVVPLTSHEPLAAQFDAFLASIETRKPTGATARDGARAVEILEVGLSANGHWSHVPALATPSLLEPQPSRE